MAVQDPTLNGEARWQAAPDPARAAAAPPAGPRLGWFASLGAGRSHDLPRTAFGFITRFGLAQQAILLLLTVASLPIYYASLDLPKQIVDKALGGKPSSFPRTVTFGGIDFGSYPQLQYLAFLSGLFLLTVLINGAFKYAINVYKGRLGEGLLRLLRSELLARVLRFPLPHFRRISQGELIAMVTGEVEALGGYFGDALVTPAFQGGLLVTALGFIFAQDVVMGLAAVALYPPQAWLIPKLQRRVNRLGYARVREVRHLSQRIGEVTSAIEAVHVNYADQIQLDTFASHLKRILDIRYDIYKKKFFIKFLNNFIAQLTPFFFLSIGGYLVLRGQLTLGSLVGVLAAYKDLAPPWKELLDFYQGQQDARIKYDQLITQFDPGGLRPPFTAEAEAAERFGDAAEITGTIEVQDLGLEEDGLVSLEQLSIEIPAGQHVALLDADGSGSHVFARALARLEAPARGRLLLDGRDLGQMPRALYSRALAFIGSPARLVNGTVADNLRLLLGPDLGAVTTETVLEAFDRVELADDLFRFGLRAVIDPEEHSALVEAILAARSRLRGLLAAGDNAGLAEPFDRERYLANATIGENLLFGAPRAASLDGRALASNAYVRKILKQTDLEAPLIELGRTAWHNLSEIFGDVPVHHQLVLEFSPIRPEELTLYRQQLAGLDKTAGGALKAEQSRLLLNLALNLTPARDRLVDLSDELIGRLLQARALFVEQLPPAMAGAIEFFDPERYLVQLSVRDNLVFGRILSQHARAAERIEQIIGALADEQGFRRLVLEAGFDYTVGIGGSQLTPQQRQKLTLAAAALRRARVLVAEAPTRDLHRGAATAILGRLLEIYKDRTVICALDDATLAPLFDRVLTLGQGQLLEDRTPEPVAVQASDDQPAPSPSAAVAELPAAS
ncbi:MAG TPA: ABC transporter transmembrane domain-containing protein [Geminicoccaceae bacterium]|nr:ABC transporter transmembrane domain-containing protein [Geminicoccaceae bacterium]